MKKMILYFCVLLSAVTYGQDAKYMQAMQKNVSILDSAKEASSFQNANNAFERIGNANQKEWLPLYYQSYCNIMIGMKQDDNNKKDEYYDRAQKLIGRADSLSPDNSEIAVLQSFIISMEISIDPMTRGQNLGMQSAMFISKAIQLNKENPRAYLLKGSGLMYTPPQYGGGKDKALPVLEEAVAKFKSFKPASPVMPHWGEARANAVLEQCKKSE